MAEKISQGDLFYHAVHGMCRVQDLTQEKRNGQQVKYCALVPAASNHMKVRFVIAIEDLQLSGFHSPISEKEASSILDFLKAGPPDTKTFAYPENQETWTLAKSLLICCFDKPVGKDQRRRQLLLMSAKGLVCELAFALHISTQEAVALIRKSLEKHCTVNPLVLNALACAAE